MQSHSESSMQGKYYRTVTSPNMMGMYASTAPYIQSNQAVNLGLVLCYNVRTHSDDSLLLLPPLPLLPALPPPFSPFLLPYPSVMVVGGDGTVNEVLNALVMQAQIQSGVNTRRSRFAPVSVNQRLGIIPAGMTNSVAQSVLGCRDPNIAAAQIMLGWFEYTRVY